MISFLVKDTKRVKLEQLEMILANEKYIPEVFPQLLEVVASHPDGKKLNQFKGKRDFSHPSAFYQQGSSSGQPSHSPRRGGGGGSGR